MRTVIATVLFICSVSASNALPSGKWLNTLQGAISDHAIKGNEPIKFVNEPRGVIDQPNVMSEYEEVKDSRKTSSFSAMIQEYLAYLMQGPGCPVPPACNVPLPVDICGTDDRNIIDNPNGMVPNQWVCRVVVEATGGPWWFGSAFKVKISPNLGRTVLFTAAHVLRNRGGGYVPRIRVQCPGDREVAVARVTDRDYWMSDEFLNRQDYDNDYAYITYAGNSNTGFGWQGYMDDAAIIAAGTNLHSCGYPTQQDTCVAHCAYPAGLPRDAKQYCDEGSLDRADDNNVFARVDIDFGQSGGPLYDTTGNNYIAYGIVSLPSRGCPDGREFERITAEKLYKMFSHIGGITMDYRIKKSNNGYLHIDGAALNSVNRVGGNVFAGPTGANDRLKIFNVYQSSSNQPDSQRVAIRSANQDNIYLRMDGTGIVANLYKGGGTVNCRYGIDDGAMEVFHKEPEPDDDKKVGFRSSTFNNVYLRIDPWEGVVNAQFGKQSLESLEREQIP